MPTSTPPSVQSLSAEVEGADLGDARLNRRLSLIVDSLADRPSASFPQALDDAELEGAYRFFGNPKVTPEAILAPHFRQTAQRAAEQSEVLVVHDTTQFEFGGQKRRKGLGRLIRPGQGFFGHFSLATSADSLRAPLGLLNIETVFRLDEPLPKAERRGTNRGEAARWRWAIDASEAALHPETRAIHVMDREADSNAVLSALLDAGRSFVIRSFRDRLLTDRAGKLQQAARAATVQLEREVPLSPRPTIRGPKGKRHPARRYRIAKLVFASTTVEFPRSSKRKAATAAPLRVRVVYVSEVDPPDGEPAVEWFLLTDLPVDTPEQLARVVDHYRGRWVIEEYFKALKTGCQYERRQLGSAHSLLNALAVLSTVAWRLLLLRHLARDAPERPASEVLTTTQIDVLKAFARKPLPEQPSIRAAMLAVAKLGGHQKQNGDPGWLVLGRGMHDLMMIERGWRAREGPQM